MLQKFRFVIILTILLAMLLPVSCTKYDKKGLLDEPGIALTFDDTSIDNWYAYLPLLDSFGAKATFYISQYHIISSEQKKKLREIQAHGHEIAFHTTNHYDMLKCLARMKMTDLLQHEIYQDLHKMNRDGFYPQTFAYPFGAHNDYLDKEIGKIFKSVRALNGTSDYSKSFTRGTNNKVLYAVGLDNKTHSLGKIEFLIDHAYQNRNCLIMVAHHIEMPGELYQVSYVKLKGVLQKVQSMKMRYYTASEISSL